MVIVQSPVLDHDLCLGETGEQLDAKQLVADTGAEGLDVGILPR
jgi:hypothetical protein